MTALAASRQEPREIAWTERTFPLKAGAKVFAGGIVSIDAANGFARAASNSTTQIGIGLAQADVDNTSGADGDLSINVVLFRPVSGRWFLNDPGGGAVTAASVGQDCFLLDDQTVTMTPTGASKVGRVWAVATKDGAPCVAVESFPFESVIAPVPVAPAYAANDSAPASIVAGGFYDVPTTGAASTITLPAAAVDGTIAYFMADGTKNAHTITYRDATGPTALTAALTASKRHLTVVTKLGGKWFANSAVSP